MNITRIQKSAMSRYSDRYGRDVSRFLRGVSVPNAGHVKVLCDAVVAGLQRTPSCFRQRSYRMIASEVVKRSICRSCEGFTAVGDHLICHDVRICMRVGDKVFPRRVSVYDSKYTAPPPIPVGNIHGKSPGDMPNLEFDILMGVQRSDPYSGQRPAIGFVSRGRLIDEPGIFSRSQDQWLLRTPMDVWDVVYEMGVVDTQERSDEADRIWKRGMIALVDRCIAIGDHAAMSPVAVREE